MTTDTASLTVLGAAGTVTGSKTVLRSGASSVLVDCGLFQGLRDLRRRNWRPLAVDPAGIDAVLLTHAHLDHCGYLPRLCDDGFGGAAYATPTTAELARIVLLDSAHLLEEEARFAARGGWSRHEDPRPLYDADAAHRAGSRLVPVPFGERATVADGVSATWRPAGHILGSASLQVTVGDLDVVFSGDLGRPGHPLLVPPSPPPRCDALVVESTYGVRQHPERDLSRLAEVVRRTVRRGGTVLVPAFAVDRTEVVLCALADLLAAGEIPDVPVFVDSPMALETLEVYRKALGRLDPDVRPVTGDPFAIPRLEGVQDAEASRALNHARYPCVLVSASGMATGGRVLHHLAAQLPDARNSVLLVGYQAVGTRGRALLEGARSLKVHGRYVPVHAEVVDLQGFSVHADADEILAWLGSAPEPPGCCYVVHGEEASAEGVRDRVIDELGWTAVVPREGETVLV